MEEFREFEADLSALLQIFSKIIKKEVEEGDDETTWLL